MVGDVRHIGDRLAGFRGGRSPRPSGSHSRITRCGFLRWQFYLSRQAVTVPIASSALVFGAGLSLSITPAKLGEIVKSYLLREMHDVPARAPRRSWSQSESRTWSRCSCSR